jgi:hypothetical protein
MDDREKQINAYDSFRSYVHQNMRRENAKLSVVDFRDAPEAGRTQLRLPLTNCFRGSEELFRLVKEYHPQASLVTQEDITTGNPLYIANIPWDDRPRPRPGYAPAYPRRGAPSLVTPMLYCMGLMATAMAASFTTTSAQWLRLFGY